VRKTSTGTSNRPSVAQTSGLSITYSARQLRAGRLLIR
jgi:hypothetical protein